jgi:DNA-binding response OmpR family regulator
MVKRVWYKTGNDPEYEANIKSQLSKAGFEVIFCEGRQEDGSTEQENQAPDLLLIDFDSSPEAIIQISQVVSSPGEDSHALPSYPIIAVSGNPTTEEMLRAFLAGANDYVSKKADTAELIARCNNLIALFQRIHRGNNRYEVDIRYGDLYIATKQHKVFRDGTEISFTPKEYELLLFLARHNNEVCTREMLLQEVWGYDFTGKTNVVDVYIKHIRSKLDKGRRRKLLHTVRGAGYMLQ